MQGEQKGVAEGALVSVRTMEIVVALILLAGSAIVITDSVRIGHGWQEGLGPAPGYFPFYVALFMAISAGVILLTAALRRKDDGGVFVTRREFGRVLSVLVPAAVFVAAIGFLGIYVSSALFIAAFMVAMGGEPVWKSAIVGIAVPLLLFFMFERWFLVPLPKGPLEAMLGLG